MARAGTFIGPAETFGQRLNIIHPKDNKFPQFDPEIAALAGVSNETRLELQQKLDELYGAMILGRDQG